MAILVNEKTKVIVQGITGREAATFVKDMLDYGTEVVGGVTPGKKGFYVHGVPVYNTVKEAILHTRANTSVVSVPPFFAKSAVMEAVDNGIKLVVVVTERIPRHDVVEFLHYAESHNARVIGPNSLGVINPGVAKVGMIGGRSEDTKRSFKKGIIGVISRSGGMTTEISNLLSHAGFGVSTSVSIGGDPLIGFNIKEAVIEFEKDEETKAIVIFSEPGGTQEEELAEYINNNGLKKPIVVFQAGKFADEFQGIRFGHAASIVLGEKGSPRHKIKVMKEAGIRVADTLNDIVTILREVL